MIIPFSAILGKELIHLVPHDIKEAAYALGATRYEVITKIILPYTKAGHLTGFLLSFSRAIGETMAVTMLIGNVNHFAKGLLYPTNTLASVIANEFAEASNDLYLSALMGVGLTLLASSSIINIFGQWIIKKLT